MRGRDEFSQLGLKMIALGAVLGFVFPPILFALGLDGDAVFTPIVFMACVGVGVVLALLNLVLARSVITQRLGQLTQAVDAIAKDQNIADVPFSGNTDAFGKMAGVLTALNEQVQAGREHEHHQAQHVRDKEAAAARVRETLAHDFEVGVKSVMADAQKDAASLQDAARAMGESAEHSLGQAHSAIDLSDAANQGVGAVAMAAESMAENVRELTSRMRRSSEMSGEAVARVSQAEDMVAELRKATGHIEDVAELIIDIAEQTNMLALNATIEAARAGEAGKGFAVVAGEVKNLATQTAKATDEITAHITSIRGAGDRARLAMVEVSKAIEEINTISVDVTRAADEQNASIADISVNARETSDATQQSVQFIREVGDAIEQTGFAAHEMLATVDDLARRMANLAEHADEFANTVRKG